MGKSITGLQITKASTMRANVITSATFLLLVPVVALVHEFGHLHVLHAGECVTPDSNDDTKKLPFRLRSDFHVDYFVQVISPRLANHLTNRRHWL